MVTADSKTVKCPTCGKEYDLSLFLPEVIKGGWTWCGYCKGGRFYFGDQLVEFDLSHIPI